MKRKLIRFILPGIFLMLGIACESETEVAKDPVPQATATDSIHNYKGSFISVRDKAVLKGNNFIFEVEMDSMAGVLEKELQKKGLEDRAVVPVEVRGKVTQNPDWKAYSQTIKIKEVVAVGEEAAAAEN